MDRTCRYRYHIKGTNLEDCWKATFFFWCALIQEEKEIQWQIENRRKQSQNDAGMARRTDRMEYKPG